MRGCSEALVALLCSLCVVACDRGDSPGEVCESADQCRQTSSWQGLPAGQVRYERGFGYRFNGIEGERIYRRPDATAQGGFRFFDAQSDNEILMEVPESMNLDNSVSGQHNFRLLPSLLSSTAYQPFSPSDVLETSAQLPDLHGEFPASYQASEAGWGIPGEIVPVVGSDELTQGDALGLADSVWSGSGTNNDLSYLMVRQAITIGEGGVVRPGNPITLEGTADRDVSMFIRNPSGELTPLYEGEPTGQDLLRGSLVPYDVFKPGINYVEIYASTGVASPPDRPPLAEDFSSFVIGDLSTQLAAAGYTLAGGTWLVSSFDGAPLGVLDPGAPLAGGKLLYQSENVSSFVVLPDPTQSDFPDVTLDVTLGVPAVDNDLVTVWVRHDLVGITPDDQTGYYFFLRGPGGTGPAELGAAQAGLARRTPDGVTTLLASDLDGPPLSTWVADHGARNNTAEHWALRIEAVGDRIIVDLSERGDRGTPAPAPSFRVIDLIDATIASGDMALATDSQSAWFDNISINAVGIRAGLRLDMGETSADGIQSIDKIVTLPRYYLEANTIYDRLGDGSKESNANLQMSSGEDAAWIDYVPLEPLALGNVEDLTCKCSEAIAPAPIDLSGTWTFAFTVLEVDEEICQGEIGEVHVETTTLTHDTQSGDVHLVGIFSDPSITAEGTVFGYTFSYAVVFPEEGGVTDRNVTMLIKPDGLVMEGTENWSWSTNGDPICTNARSSVSAVKN